VNAAGVAFIDVDQTQLDFVYQTISLGNTVLAMMSAKFDSRRVLFL
jgi:hypothetical protein